MLTGKGSFLGGRVDDATSVGNSLLDGPLTDDLQRKNTAAAIDVGECDVFADRLGGSR